MNQDYILTDNNYFKETKQDIQFFYKKYDCFQDMI